MVVVPVRRLFLFWKQLKELFTSEEFELIAIESWSRKVSAIRNYANRKELNYTILNATNEVIKQYQTGGAAPYFFIVDQERIIRKVIRGYSNENTDKEIINAIKRTTMNMNRLFTCLCLSLLFNLAQAQLPIPEYQKGKAILSGTIANYHPNDNLIFKIGAPNIVMGTAETLYPTVESDGSFTINIPLYHHTQVRMMIGNADLVILLSPEKETNVAINLSNPPGKQFVFSGQYATINNEWCQPELITKIPPVYSDGDLLDSIVGISANEFKNDVSTNTNDM